MKDETKIVHAGRHPEDNHGVVNPPVYHASTILYPTVAAWRQAQADRRAGERVVIYGRWGTPTQYALEDAIAELEGGYRAMLFSSGLGAITSALLSFLKAGDHLLVVDTVYGPTRQFCDNMLAGLNIETSYYNPNIGADIKNLMRDNTRVIYTESPGSHTFEVQDIPAIAEIAHTQGARVMMDNTWGTPLFFKAFSHGVDISIHAGTKYIVGHSDAMLGVVTTNKENWPQLEIAARGLGQSAAPDDAYLGQRGWRTLSVRLKQHMENGIQLAEWLQGRPEIACVMHPALPDDPGHRLWKRDFTGASGLFGATFHPAPQAAVDAFIDAADLFGLGASWGGYESLLMPTNPNASRTAKPWHLQGPTVRFHAGLEAIEDQIENLTKAFAAFAHAVA